MDGHTQQPGTRAIPITCIHVSRTEAQAERRKRFDKAAIAELAESIRSVGMLSPIIGRPLNDQDIELVAGERRLLAAKAAGLTVVPVSVRDLTDQQVLEVQLVENLQREGLHELAEAEGYESLQKIGHSAEQIADKVGKSKAYVYARMKLLALTKAARKAFYDGKISASIALLLARIPVEKLQDEALKRITQWDGMSYRNAADLIQREYMLRLAEAGFKTEDATLVPAAGPCGACPKRTGNQPELFGDVKGADVCTDPICFKAKREAHAARVTEQARANGQTVISGKEAKKFFPYGESVHNNAVKLTDRCYEDAKQRTYGQILGKDFEPTLVVHPDTGKVIPIATADQVREGFKEKGVKTSRANVPGSQDAAQKKAKAEKAFRSALYGQIREKLPERITHDDLRLVALRFFEEMQQDSRKQMLALWNLQPVKKGYSLDTDTPVITLLEKATDEQLTRFLFDLVFIKDLQVYSFGSESPQRLLSTAKKLNIDPAKIRKELTAGAKAKSTKKAKGKR